MNFETRYNQKKQWVESHLQSLLPTVDSKSKTLYEAMMYSVNAGGKRIRPILLLSTCELCKGDTENAMPFACAIEYIHTYSLIHDDLPAMDDDDYRRGKPSNHKVYGEAAAILAGDGLLNAAMEIICTNISSSMDDFDIVKNKISAAKEIFTASGCKGMVGGQMADIEAEAQQISKEHLEYIHMNKTAALIMASVRAGGFLGGASDDLMKKLTLFSENLGLAFQITDDILDICGDEKLLGKSLRSDIKQDKTTYPLLYGIEASREKVKTLHAASYEILDQYEGTDFLKAILKQLTDRVN